MIKIIPLLLILLGVSSRLLPHPDNFAPITAIALFGAVYLPRKYAFLLPITAMIISDLVIGFYGVTMLFVYGSFLVSGLIGLWVKDRKNPSTVILGTLLASIFFYLITNFGVWANPASWYPRDFNGLMQSYIAGIPFFRNTLLGDLFYTGALFGIYELAHYLGKRFLPAKIIQLYF